MKALVLFAASIVVGVGLFVLALMHGDLGRVIEWFFASHVAPVVEGVVSVLLLWVMLRALWGWYRDWKYRQMADD